MEVKNKPCFRCKYFDCYYVKGAKGFNKIKCGRCFNRGATVSIHDGCEEFKERPTPRIDRGHLKYNLYELLREITTIRNLIEAELSENEDM